MCHFSELRINGKIHTSESSILQVRDPLRTDPSVCSQASGNSEMIFRYIRAYPTRSYFSIKSIPISIDVSVESDGVKEETLWKKETHMKKRPAEGSLWWNVLPHEDTSEAEGMKANALKSPLLARYHTVGQEQMECWRSLTTPSDSSKYRRRG